MPSQPSTAMDRDVPPRVTELPRIGGSWCSSCGGDASSGPSVQLPAAPAGAGRGVVAGIQARGRLRARPYTASLADVAPHALGVAAVVVV